MFSTASQENPKLWLRRAATQ